MTSRINLDFLKLYWALPRNVQDRARTAYRQWEADASHPGLDFKRVHPTFPLWNARIDQNYRAVGLREAGPEGGEITWFFVGTHAAYDRLLRGAQASIRGQEAKGRPPGPAVGASAFVLGSRVRIDGGQPVGTPGA